MPRNRGKDRPTNLGKLPLAEVDTLLVKFSFTNPKHIPADIPEQERGSDTSMDVRHQLAAIETGIVQPGQNGGVAAVGRHRDSRVDTGEPIAQNVTSAKPTLLLVGLPENGFFLKSVHWYKHDRGGGQAVKYVVVCTYERGPGMIVPTSIANALRSLAEDAVWHCHIWHNPPNKEGKRTATVNFVVRQPRSNGARALHTIYIRDGDIVAAPMG